MKWVDTLAAKRAAHAARRSGCQLPPDIVEDFIGGIALIVICLGVPFLWAMLT